MVRIASPPPTNLPDPAFFELVVGSQIIRIFDPTRFGTQALTFRFNGPRHRFDHQRGFGNPTDDLERGIYYAAFTLSGCLVECFGDLGVIEIGEQCVCLVSITRLLRLLDLRGSGGMKAGSVAALSKIADRQLSQEWSRYFYENETIYSRIDGIIYSNAHNDEEAIALYERSKDGLACPSDRIMRLDSLSLRPAIQDTALQNNLIFIP